MFHYISMKTYTSMMYKFSTLIAIASWLTGCMSLLKNVSWLLIAIIAMIGGSMKCIEPVLTYTPERSRQYDSTACPSGHRREAQYLLINANLCINVLLANVYRSHQASDWAIKHANRWTRLEYYYRVFHSSLWQQNLPNYKWIFFPARTIPYDWLHQQRVAAKSKCA